MASNASRRSHGIALLLEQTARSIYEHREAGGLYPAQWSALRYFARAGRGARTTKGLAKYLGVTPAPASRTATSLIRRGFVTAAKSADDGRVTIHTLTDAGLALLKQDPLLNLAKAINSLDAADQSNFAALLDDVSSRLQADDRPPVTNGRLARISASGRNRNG